MLYSLLASGGVAAPLYWSDYNLTPYLVENLFGIGWLDLRYYSLAYIVGLGFAYWHLSRMVKTPGAPMAQRHVDDLFFFSTLGVILGGRIGYSLFYKPELWSDPLALLKVWEGGMSFHGGLIGVTLAMFYVARRDKLSFMRVVDYVSVCVPMGMMLGRLANFNNGELWGRPTDVAWGMVFPGGGPVVRHPSQLYQAGLEGLALLIILMLLFWKTGARYRTGLLAGVFVTGIAAARFVSEFYREPDAHLVRFAEQTGLSMGQWLTIPLILTGLIVIAFALKRPAMGTATGSGATPAE